MINNSAAYLTTLHKLINQHFDLAEIRTLCFDLSVDYESVPGEEKPSRIRELILALGRYGRLPDLITLLQQKRPHVDWPPVPDDLQLPEPLDAGGTAVSPSQYDVDVKGSMVGTAVGDGASVMANNIVGGDMVGGDKVNGDKITVGDVSGGSVVAVGRGATAVGLRGVYVSGSVSGNIHTGDVINYYVTSTQTFFPQFIVGIQNFLTNYLGTDKKPVPFGGRDRQLKQLDDWLTEGETQRLLLVAPAGRGKSALLARWSQQLTAVDNLAVVFMPISLRFNTNREGNTFVILATRLAHFYGKQIPTSYGNQSPRFWRGLVAEYLREPLPDGRQLLLILDGLDEAAWDVSTVADILPLNLPATTRIVASARYLGGEEQSPAPWRRRLGWDSLPGLVETIELEKLTLDGVRDVMQKMGCPLDELGRNVDIVAELYRLSDGDPLLLELYVKDLWEKKETAARLKPEDLRNIKPGYKGYFDRWWDEQKRLWGARAERPLQEQLVRASLNLLALAYGPLLIEDIQELLPETMTADSILIREAVDPLARFVIGDGQEQGYAFSHPKLTDYFREQLTRRDRAAWQARFLAWGKRTLSDLQAEKVNPYDVPRYLMLYYGRHLEEANADVEEMLPLVSWEWIQVWHKKTGSYAGLLQDVDRVWGRLRVANEEASKQEQEAPYIGQEILCALCHASVNSLADNIPDELLALLLQYGLWTEEQVIAYIRQRTDAKKRIDAFALVLPYLSDEIRTNIEREIVAAVREIHFEGSRANALAAVALHLPQETLTAAQEIVDDGYRAEVLAAVAPHLPEDMRLTVLEEALVAAREIRYRYSRAKVLAAIAPHLPEGMRTAVLAALKEALVVEEMDDLFPGEYEARVKAIASHLPQVALAAAQGIRNKWERAKVLAVVAPQLPEERRTVVLKEVLAAARETNDERGQAQVLAAIASYLPVEMCSAVLEEALVAARASYEGYRAETLVAVVPHLSPEMRMTVLEEALAAARAIRDEYDRTRVLMDVAPHLLPQEVLVAAKEICYEKYRAEVLADVVSYLPQEALTAARRISDDGYRAGVLAAAAPHLPQEVLAAAREIGDERYRVRVLAAVVPHLPQEVLAAAREIGDERRRASVLVAIAPYLPQEALAAAREIRNEWRRARVLATVAPHLPQEALAAAQEIGDEESRADVLVAIASYLPQGALATARAIGYEGNRARVLAAVAPHLPQETLAAAQEIGAEGYRAEVLAAIAPHLPQETLAATREVSDESDRADVLAAIAPHLPQEVFIVAREVGSEWLYARILKNVASHLPQETLAATREVSDESDRADVLESLALHLPQEALAAAQEICDELHRVRVLEAIVPHLPQAVLAAAQEIGDEKYRAEVLTAVAPYLPEEMRLTVLEKALAAVRVIDSEWNRANAFTDLSDYLLGFSQSHLYKMWQETLPVLSQRTRPHILADIRGLMPIIHRLGGEKGVRDTFHAVQTISAWWP